MNRREFLTTSLITTLQVSFAQNRRPNLLFLIADDHRFDVLGSAGTSLALTPNLDELAYQSTVFTHHYVNSPVCTPSRQSVFTGLQPHAAGVTELGTPLGQQYVTLAELLRENDYRTAAFGKMHFNRKPEPGLHGLEVCLLNSAIQQAWEREVKPRPVPPSIRTKPPWRPFRVPARIWLNADKLPYARYDADMLGTFIARKSMEFLKANKDKPFALWISFKEPHSPFDFPIEDRNLYEPEQFTAPSVGPEDPPQIPLIFRDLSDEDKRGIIAAYYTSVHFLDRNIGRVLQALEDLRLAQNTLVVYWGDNGYMLGEHGRFEKHCFYEPSMRVPLMFRFPGELPERRRVPALTESVDITATILDLLGISVKERLHGRSLRPLMDKPQPASFREAIFSEYIPNEEACVRTDRWKFIYCSGKRRRTDGYVTDNPTPGRYVKLFDLENDPGEFRNVALKHPDLVDEFKQKLLGWFRQTHPEAPQEPRRLSVEEALDWYLRSRELEYAAKVPDPLGL